MHVFLSLVMLFVGLPLVGLYNFENIYFSTYSINVNTFDGIYSAYQSYLIAMLISFLLTAAALLTFRLKRPQNDAFDPYRASNARLAITIFMVMAAIAAFFLGGQQIIAGTIHRGELRTSFGGAGFLYKLLIVFLVPAALAYSGALYKLAIDSGQAIGFPFLHLVLCVLTTAMMGYKAAILIGLIPFFMIVVPTMTLKTQLFAGGAALSLMVVYSWLVVIDTDGSALDVARYLVVRATQGTAWGLAASWDVAANPNPEAYRVLLPVFGPRVTADMLGIPLGTIDQLQFSAGRYVSYLAHPHPELVLAGETNLTITLAGEAIYLLGRELFWIAGIPAGILTAVFAVLFLRNNQENSMITQVILAIYAINIFLPILNSGNSVAIYSAYTIFYIGMTTAFIYAISLISQPYGRQKISMHSTRPLEPA